MKVTDVVVHYTAKDRYEMQYKNKQALRKSLEPKAKEPELIGSAKPAKPEYK